MKFKVLIPASGRGESLGEISDFISPALVKVGKKPAISYVIDSYPSDTCFVVTTGYKGDQVEDFLNLVYPDRDIEFVHVHNFSGPGSGFLTTLLAAKNSLQESFVYHTADTILLDDFLPSTLPKGNWIAGFKGYGSAQYAGINTSGSQVDSVCKKGTVTPDYLHVGQVCISDYQLFWESAETIHAESRGSSDIDVLNAMISKGVDFSLRKVSSWYDTGNIDGLNHARRNLPDSFHILDKLEESIYLFDDFVVKFFADKTLVDKRVERGNILSPHVPEIQGRKGNFFRYKFAEGELYSRAADPENFVQFFEWCRLNLWIPTSEVSDSEFKKICYDFYYTKTIKRVNSFLEKNGIVDEINIINGLEVPKLVDIFAAIDFDWLATTQQSNFHGDCILDNILMTENGFCLLDWRQDFGGLLKSGDMYYDLAKLNHNLTVNHDIVNDNLFSLSRTHDMIRVDIFRKDLLVQSQVAFHKAIQAAGFDLRRVKILTGLIWLNMSPLHHHPFDKFLFYFGKYNLWKALQERN